MTTDRSPFKPDDMGVHLTAYGTGLRGSGYPNATNTLDMLRHLPGWQVVDRVDWLPEHLHLWRLARGPWSARFATLSGLVVRALFQALRLQFARRAPNAFAYVPYPSLFTLYWLSWMPRHWRQRVAADAYISVWDSMFRDRVVDPGGSMGSRILHHLEGRALRTADVVLVDTEANARQMTTDFRLDPDRVHSVPLAIDEAPFLAIQPCVDETQGRVRVLFVGTMIPLHGIEVVLEAIHALRDEAGIEFRLVGDGQLGGQVEHALRECGNTRVTWLRGWQSLDVIAREIDEADICLGIFGGSEKAARVLPFKLYMYLAAGRAVISQKELSVPAGTPDPPIEYLDLQQSDALSSTILRLAEEPDRRERLARLSRTYFQFWLSGARLTDVWHKLSSVLP